MTLDTSKKILKIMGILCIIFGAITIISAALLLVGGKAAVASGQVAASADDLRALTIGSVFALIAGLVTFLQGIFSTRAAKDFSKIQPAWIFAVIGLVVSVIDAAYGIVKNTSGNTIVTAAISIALSVLVFAAANNIKKSVGE